MHSLNMTRQRISSPVAFLVLVILGSLLVVSAPAIAADYPPGNPPDTVEYSDAGTIIDYKLRIVNVELDAEEILRAFDPSMGSASDTAWVMIQVEATYTGDLVGYPADDMEYTVSDNDGNTYDLFSHACPAWPFSPDDVTLQPGETARFNLCFAMPAWLVMPYWMVTVDGDEYTVQPDEHMELIVYTNILTDQWPVAFSLNDPNDDDSFVPCGCLEPPA